MKKFLKISGISLVSIFVLLGIVIALGPKVTVPQLDTKILASTANLVQLEKEIEQHEQALPNIRTDNEAKIIWANPAQKEKTPYSVVYLHGFSASHGEGAPMHELFAQRYGCNLYLTRLYGHGLQEEEALLDWTPEKYMETAKAAIAVGQQLGEKVILMGTSTGCTAGIFLASGNPDIAALINYSPNIDVANEQAWLLTLPWGLQMGQYVSGSDYHSWDPLEGTHNLVTSKYRLEAVVNLKSMIDATMTEATFQQVKQPFFMGYWYKNEEVKDDVVSVSRMLEMYDQLGTPAALKQKVAFANATNHVLPSPLWNKDFETVKAATFDFAENILKLKAVEQKEIVEEMELVEQ